MSSKAEKDLQKAYAHHRSGEFKKGMKSAEKARKRFLKEKLTDRALEALRVMADCAVNARDMQKATNLYTQLLEEGEENDMVFFQAAANWGLGEVAAHRMDYEVASIHFETGLGLARRIADKWFTAWNAFGLGKAYRGIGRIEDSRIALTEALNVFNDLNENRFVTWVDKLLKDMGGEVPTDEKVWLCPMCGSRLTREQAESLSSGKIVTCEYCGTSVG
jgi:tetratricopeptide (TPR) repeat protein